LATQGEGLHLEYKEKLPDTREEKRHVFKTVVAFANGDGGALLFGIRDDGEACGLVGKPQDVRSRLNDLIRDLVSPSPEVRVEVYRYNGHNILALHVGANSGIIYALTLNSNKPEFYVRRDGTTFYAQPDEIASIIKKAGATQNRAWIGSW
jgi:predicted HTH transcriptional regulator